MRVERREVLTSAPEKVKEDVKTQKGRTERPPFWVKVIQKIYTDDSTTYLLTPNLFSFPSVRFPGGITRPFSLSLSLFLLRDRVQDIEKSEMFSHICRQI